MHDVWNTPIHRYKLKDVGARVALRFQLMGQQVASSSQFNCKLFGELGSSVSVVKETDSRRNEVCRGEE